MEKYIHDSLVAVSFACPPPQLEWASSCPKKITLCIRPCINYRGLNAITVRNKYPLPLIKSAFELIHDATVFSNMDLRNTYHLVRIREGDE